MAEDAAKKKKTADRLDELEKMILTKEKVEEIAAAAALDVLKIFEKEVRDATHAVKELGRAFEEREFARRVAATLDSRACRRKLDDMTSGVDEEAIAEAVEAKANEVIASRLEGPELAEKVNELAGAAAGGGEEIQELKNRLAARMDAIEQEALPKLLAKLLDEKLEEKFGAVSAEAIGARQEELVRKAIDEKLDEEGLQQVVIQSARGSLAEVVNTTEFKAALDDKFKVMLNYLANEVIPKQIRKLTGG
jgi:hypothetical protein